MSHKPQELEKLDLYNGVNQSVCMYVCMYVFRILIYYKICSVASPFKKMLNKFYAISKTP